MQNLHQGMIPLHPICLYCHIPYFITSCCSKRYFSLLFNDHFIINRGIYIYTKYGTQPLLTQICYYGYDYNISFLHTPQYNKLPLTYDLIELLRSDIDNIVLNMAKNRKIKLNDFTLTDNGYYLIKEEKIKKYLKEIKPIENKTKNTVKDFTKILTTIT